MYYETYRGRRHERRQRRHSGCLGRLVRLLCKLLAFILVLAVICAGLLYAIPVSFFNVEPAGKTLSLTDGLSDSRINILLLGLDVLNEGSQRSDSMMIASIGYGTFKLTSVMRDTLVNIPGHGMQKLNSAYAFGGADLAMQMVNETFALNITHYVVVDFVTLVKLVDAIGGVDLEITDAEKDQININVAKSAPVFLPLGYTAQPLSSGGSLHLNGLFALGYARIRKIDSDYVRASRQRKLLNAMLTQFRSQCWKPSVYQRLWRVYKEEIDTNLSLISLLSIGEKAALCGEIATYRAPADDVIADDGSAITITDSQAAINALHAFIYG